MRVKAAVTHTDAGFLYAGEFTLGKVIGVMEGVKQILCVDFDR